MLGVDVGAHASVALGFGNHVHGERRLTRRLRTEDFGHATSRQPPDSECKVERQRTSRHNLDRHVGAFAHLHDSASTELLVDLSECHLEGLALLLVGS